jgi:UDP-N-acetyl-2-amino-2-deoxyglucuronate dehydrogenase
MRIGIIGTGGIARMHARAFTNIGWTIRACTNRTPDSGRTFAADHGAEFLESYEEICGHPEVDLVDVCTFPSFRLEAVRASARHRKPVQVEKPIAVNLDAAGRMVEISREADIVLGVVSQHRFDTSSMFLASAIRAGRLGRLLQCDAYVKWQRSDQYYARPGKGSWDTEGGGALINQAIHQVDLLLWLAGPVTQVAAMWQLGATHKIESEDVVCAVLSYENGATGVIQASTSIQPGYPERLEFHGTKGTAIVTGDKLTTWDVRDDTGEPPPLTTTVASGASDPMAISVESFERQFRDLEAAISAGRKPLVAGEEGYRALALVDAIYRSCRSRAMVRLARSEPLI